MEFVEITRLRVWTLWWCAIVALLGILFALAATIGSPGTLDINGSRLDPSAGILPLSAIAGLTMFFAQIYATSAGLSLNREGMLLDLAWTKPLSRYAIAARYLTVDTIATLLAYGFAWSVAIAALSVAHAHLFADPNLGVTLVITTGVAVMWLALIQMLTAAFTPRAAMIAGIIWPIALTLASIEYGLRGFFGTLVRALNVFNPLAYLSSVSMSAGATTVNGYWSLSLGERAAAVWLLALVFFFAATIVWSRRQV